MGFLQKKKKKQKQQGKTSGVNIYYCENLHVYSIPTSARERAATM